MDTQRLFLGAKSGVPLPGHSWAQTSNAVPALVKERADECTVEGLDPERVKTLVDKLVQAQEKRSYTGTAHSYQAREDADLGEQIITAATRGG